MAMPSVSSAQHRLYPLEHASHAQVSQLDNG